MVRRAEQEEPARASGAAEVVIGDLRDDRDVDRAIDGCRAIYHICPNMSPDEVAIGRRMIDACRRAGVDRLIYHSVLHPQTEAMPHHWAKLRVEEALIESPLSWTILQPAAYMQNLLAGWRSIIDEGIYRIPYAAETRIGMVDLLDVAEVAARVLVADDHDRASYELAGSEAPTQTEIALRLGAGLGRRVKVEVIARDRWRELAREEGLAESAIETLVAMFRFYERHGFRGNSRVLAWLLGRRPTSLADFIARHR